MTNKVITCIEGLGLKMNILFASDDNYAPLLGVAMYSLLENNEMDFDEIDFYILDGGISERNKSKIKSICEGFEIETPLKFIEYDNLEELLGIRIKATRPLSAFARLFAASLLPASVDRIIYIDCDGLIVGSLKEVWECDISGYDCGAVFDVILKYHNMQYGLPDDWRQYNSGFLLIDLKRWRDENLEEKFLNLIVERKGEVFHNDQGVINIVCRDRIYTLKPHYNIRSPLFEVGYYKFLHWYGNDEYYTKELVEDAIRHPVFIHLTQFVHGRPWFTNAQDHPLRETFDYYAQKTDFKDEIYIKDNRNFRGKFLSFTYKILPYSMVCWLFSIYRGYVTRRLK